MTVSPLRLLETRLRLPTLRRIDRLVIRGAREEVERFVRLEEFGALFGGFIIWAAPPTERGGTPVECIGVWGSRTIPRFRRILRERGAKLAWERVEDSPPLPILAIHQAPRRTRHPGQELSKGPSMSDRV